MRQRELVRSRGAESDVGYDTEPPWRSLASKTLLVVAIGISLVLLSAAAAFTFVRDGGDLRDAAVDGGEVLSDASSGSASSSSTDPSSSSSSSASTSSTAPTTTTTAVPSTEVPVTPPTTAAPPTTPPSTAAPTTAPTTTSTTAPPAPVIDSFAVNFDRGCGDGRSPASFSWSTSQTTTVLLGRVQGSPSEVPADGQATVCVDDDGETWRLTASGSGGTTTRDLRADP